jgi:radical SAM protein with 4Fe4S-binding SPASM domain
MSERSQLIQIGQIGRMADMRRPRAQACGSCATSCGSSASSHPRFGSPEVAPYGAVGLDDDVIGTANLAAGDEMPTANGADRKQEVHRISERERLPLIGGLAHHRVDDAHLWIAVQDGKVLVANDTDDAILRVLIDGEIPVNAARRVLHEGWFDDDAAAWTATVSLIGRLAAAGFIEGIQGYHSVKKVQPYSFARFHLTQRCQLECVHCYTSSSPYLPKEDELPVERWIQLVDDFANNGGQKILFTGGEALVYPGATAIMRRAHDRGLEVTLFSNGILIPRYINELKETADIVQISIDGPGEESHDAIRGPGSFKKAMRAIHMLLDAGIDTRMSTTIMMNNWPAIRDGLPKLISEFENTKLSFRISYGVMAHGRGESLDHSLDSAAVRRFVDDLLSRVKTSENRYNGPTVVQKITGCGYAEQLVVSHDGTVYPCHLLSGALGHIDDLPLRDITRYLSRTARAFSVDNRLGCSTCDLRNLCGGTCRVEDEKHTGSRLITTCTDDDKLRRKRFLVARYKPVGAP